MTEAAAEHFCEWRTVAEALLLRVEAAEARAAALEAKLAEQSEQLEALKRRVFGKKSEKMPRPADELKKRDQPPPDPELTRKRREDGRRWQQTVPEVEVLHPLPPDLPTCELCQTLPYRELPTKVSYELEYQPGHFVRRKHVRAQVGCQCGHCVVAGPAPQRVVDNGMYGPGFMAWTVVSKVADVMPLYRLAKALAREGVTISPNTLGDLFHRAAVLLEPLYKRLLTLIAAKDLVQADETPIQVQAKEKTRRAWVWTFLSGNLVAYVFSPSRSGQTPVKVLGSTQGTLVVDAYTGYNKVVTPEQRERGGCLAHCRRKYFEARSSAPEASAKALDLILDVYKVEHEAKERGIVRSPDHAELRRTKSKAAMDALHAWAEAEQANHLPQSPMGKAIGYTLEQWPHLTHFLGRVDVPVDNNGAEAALRVVAQGRDSFLFVGNDTAGEHLATLLSLVRTATVCGKNPQRYLADVLLRIQEHPQSRIDELLPQNWQPPDVASG